VEASFNRYTLPPLILPSQDCGGKPSAWHRQHEAMRLYTIPVCCLCSMLPRHIVAQMQSEWACVR